MIKLEEAVLAGFHKKSVEIVAAFEIELVFQRAVPEFLIADEFYRSHKRLFNHDKSELDLIIGDNFVVIGVIDGRQFRDPLGILCGRFFRKNIARPCAGFGEYLRQWCCDCPLLLYCRQPFSSACDGIRILSRRAASKAAKETKNTAQQTSFLTAVF